jgi:phenylalanyl-tRNA synthetase beta chain
MEKMKLSLFLSGDSFSESWSQKVSKMDLFWAKGFVIKIFNRLNINPNLVLTNDKFWGEYLSFDFEGQEIVSLKNVPSNVLSFFGIKQNVIYVDFNWEIFLESSSNKEVSFSHLPKFPKIRRDLSLLLNKDISFDDLKKDAFISSKKLLKDVIIFDVFTAKDMVDKKSYALGFVFQDYDKTLTDDIINKEIKRIFYSFQQNFDVQLRDGELN